MPIVTPSDIIKNNLLKKFGGKVLVKGILSILGISRCNEIYDNVKNKNLKNIEALDAILEESDLKYICPDFDISRIPQEGPFIVVSNHPFGVAEGMILMRILASVRPDIKVLANFMLSKIEIINNYCIEVNPFEKKPHLYNSSKNLRVAYKHIGEGHPLLIFPAGEVSTWHKGFSYSEDRSWNQPIMKFIKKSNVPILPIYVDGSNSKLFHMMGKIHWALRTLWIPREYINKRHKLIKIRIGIPIPLKEQDRYEDLETYSKVLKLYCYSLRLSYRKLEKAVSPAVSIVQEIAPPAPRDKVLQEISDLRANPESTLITTQNYTVFCTKPDRIPNVMHEIARLREVSFREVGEGTNNPTDTDEFDQYFYQLFVWDDHENQMVGAYRIGIGEEIMKERGIDGFYISTLFDFDKAIYPFAQNALELGRSFIVTEYQKKHTSLFALWKGLLLMLLKTKYNYLVGAVSISGKFSAIAKALTIQFIKDNYYDNELAALTKNKEKSSFKLIKEFDKKTFKLVTRGDFAMLDSFVQSIDPDFTTPILVRQYITMLNTKAIGFNVDPQFNNCLDALIYMDIREVARKSLVTLSKDFEQTKDLKNLIELLKD